MILKQIFFLSRVVKVGASYPVPRIWACTFLCNNILHWNRLGDVWRSETGALIAEPEEFGLNSDLAS